MKNNKGFAPILIALIVVAVLAVGGVAYYVGKKSNTLPKVEENQNGATNVPVDNITSTPTPTPIPMPPAPTPKPKPKPTPAPVSCTSTSSSKPIKVLSPNGGETFHIGDTMNITWDICGFDNNVFDISLMDYSHNIGSTGWQNVIASDVSRSQTSYSFVIPAQVSMYGGSQTLDHGNVYKINISTLSAMNNGMSSANMTQDSSDATFSIFPVVPPVLQTIYSNYKNGQISECTDNGIQYYTASSNAYDGGGQTFNINGNVVGTCQGFSGQCTGVNPISCSRIYAVYPNIWGYPAINTYNLH